VARLEHHPGELSSQVGFIVTNLKADSRDVLRFNTRDGVALDQARQASGEDDAAQWPLVPIGRGAALAERDRQSGQPEAMASVAEEDCELVADEIAVAAGEDERSAGKTCAP